MSPPRSAEATAWPWWVILEVGRIGRAGDGLGIAQGIRGPFVSREEAERALERGRYDGDAEVWCLSGSSAPWWRSQCVENEEEVSQ